MSTTAERPSKKEAFLALLREGWTSLHLDARRTGVDVPAYLRKEAHLVLQYGFDLPIPIPDLNVDDVGVKATLSFSQTPHPTFVPWSAVYVVACDDGRGILFAEDVPPDVSVIAARPPEGTLGEPITRDGMEVGSPSQTNAFGDLEGADQAVKGERPSRSLRAVTEEETFDPAAIDQTTTDAAMSSKKKKRPTLRLVK